MPGSRIPCGAALFAGMLILSSCVAPENAGTSPSGGPTPEGAASVSVTEQAAPQPRLATYSCGEDGSISIESLGDAVRILGTDGVSVDLPAAPPAQTARFGGSSQAIVIENDEALYMVAGKPTLNCRRS
ncbi:MAG TPA: hypothetical protein VGN98_05085 [Tianweitania sediminis]|nr:hypothetical protein [Tianweitania sediminis]